MPVRRPTTEMRRTRHAPLAHRAQDTVRSRRAAVLYAIQLRTSIQCSSWGEQAQLDRLIQAYAVEKARIEARKQGHTVTEQTLPNGAIRLLVHVAGGAA